MTENRQVLIDSLPEDKLAESNSALVSEGDLVDCSSGWQDYSVHAD